MKLRVNNMALAKSNTQIIRGLTQVCSSCFGQYHLLLNVFQIEQSQVIEYGLANNLTGNPTIDMPVLKKLQGDFQAGIQKNKALQSLATGTVAVPVPMQTRAV